MQSTNEELINLNQKLVDRNEQYNKSRIYAEAIVSTIHEHLLVLNYNFSVRSANKAFYHTFSLAEKNTLGKILFEIENNAWQIPGLKDQLLKIKQHKKSFIEWETTAEFPSIGERTISFNAQPIPDETGSSLYYWP